jgi:hypothetical protein
VSKLSRTAASPRGKAQESIMTYLAESPQVVELTDMAAIPSLRGVHFDKIMSAVEALQKKGLVKVRGTGVSSKQASADFFWVTSHGPDILYLRGDRHGDIGSLEKKGVKWMVYDEDGGRPIAQENTLEDAKDALLDHLDIADSNVRQAAKTASASRVAANWIQDAIKRPGRLHKFFNVPEDEDIPEEKIEGEIKTLRKKKERSKKDTSLLRALNLAETLESFHKSAHLLTPVQRRAALARILLERH